jgi:hypothetical protein
MTDTGKYRTISFCVSEEFDAVEVMFAKIQDEYNLSRAEIFRVIMHDFFNVPEADMERHHKWLARINKVIGREQT